LTKSSSNQSVNLLEDDSTWRRGNEKGNENGS
jgi:hypothetical protein